MAEETGLEPASPKAAVFKTAALPIMLLLRGRYCSAGSVGRPSGAVGSGRDDESQANAGGAGLDGECGAVGTAQ